MRAMRRLALLTAVIGMLAAAPAMAQVTLPSLLSTQIQKINAAPKAPPVLLPRSLPLDGKHLYPSGSAEGASYDIPIGAVKNCHDADACFVADFAATKATTIFGKRVTVAGASRAGFTPLSCGASCAPPQIDFIVHGFRYTIQANLKKTSKGDKSVLIAAADSAIAAGAR
jgi:hypothetical protein